MIRFILWISLSLIATSCRQCGSGIRDVVSPGGKIEEHVVNDINYLLSDTVNTLFIKDDSVRFIHLIQKVHVQGNSLWTSKGEKKPAADSLIQIIRNSIFYGLRPGDLLAESISNLSDFSDSETGHLDAMKIAEFNIALSEAFFRLCSSVHGMTSEREFENKFRTELAIRIEQAVKNNSIRKTIELYEPRLYGYVQLKNALASYIYQTNNSWSKERNDYKDISDIITRLKAEGFIHNEINPDSVMLKDAVSCFQERYGIEPDGVPGEATIKAMKVPYSKRLEIIHKNLNRWKELALLVDSNYVLVNTASCELYYICENDCIFNCKVIVGEPDKQTPVLSSSIDHIITYPYWNVPFSIATKEILPKVTEDPTYLLSQNMEVLDKERNVIDPLTINWSELSEKNFRYHFRQKEGTENSLGVIKFNFLNKHGVYLHDTNSKGLFSKSNRFLSHGCVRVEKPLELADLLIKNNASSTFSAVRHSIDKKIRRTVMLNNPVPIFIRYFTVTTENGQLKFHPDIYKMD